MEPRRVIIGSVFHLVCGLHLVSRIIAVREGLLGLGLWPVYVGRTEFSQRGNGERKRDVV